MKKENNPILENYPKIIKKIENNSLYDAEILLKQSIKQFVTNDIYNKKVKNPIKIRKTYGHLSKIFGLLAQAEIRKGNIKKSKELLFEAIECAWINGEISRGNKLFKKLLKAID